MAGSNDLIVQGSAVAIEDRALLILGAPGTGKSSLALSLIDRGAVLIGDDGVAIARQGGRLIAAPPPNIAGKLEIRNVGIIDLPATIAPLCLILQLCEDAPRYLDQAEDQELAGTMIPMLRFQAGDAVQALRAEWALRLYGLPRTGN